MSVPAASDLHAAYRAKVLELNRAYCTAVGGSWPDRERERVFAVETSAHGALLEPATALQDTAAELPVTTTAGAAHLLGMVLDELGEDGTAAPSFLIPALRNVERFLAELAGHAAS